MNLRTFSAGLQSVLDFLDLFHFAETNTETPSGEQAKKQDFYKNSSYFKSSRDRSKGSMEEEPLELKQESVWL